MNILSYICQLPSLDFFSMLRQMKKSPIVVDDVCSEQHETVAHESAKHAALGQKEAQRMGEFFSVLADPTRLRLVSLLAAEEFCVCDLAAALGMTESAISHQLRALRAGRLVSYRKEGRQVFYRLHDHHVLELYQTVREHLEE
jgi:ArsR family transcriptional regulator, lead/cadmium/zinc/bismuth-responsive transcriptional repressor